VVCPVTCLDHGPVYASGPHLVRGFVSAGTISLGSGGRRATDQRTGGRRSSQVVRECLLGAGCYPSIGHVAGSNHFCMALSASALTRSVGVPPRPRSATCCRSLACLQLDKSIVCGGAEDGSIPVFWRVRRPARVPPGPCPQNRRFTHHHGAGRHARCDCGDACGLDQR
jgi:hypothetical protein